MIFNFLKNTLLTLNNYQRFLFFVLIIFTGLLGIFESFAVFESGQILVLNEFSKEALSPLFKILIFSSLSAFTRLFISYISMVLATSISSNLARKISENILFASVRDQLSFDNASKMSVLIIWMNHISGGIIQPIVNIFSSIIGIIGIISGILILNKKFAILGVLTIGIIYLILSKLTRIKLNSQAKIIERYTDTTNEYANLISSYAKQVTGSFSRNYLLNKYSNSYKKRESAKNKKGFLQSYMKHLIELIAYILVGAIVFFIANNPLIDIKNAISSLFSSLFAAYRLLPFCQATYVNLTTITTTSLEANNLYKWLIYTAKKDKSNIKLNINKQNDISNKLEIKSISSKLKNQKSENIKIIKFKDFIFKEGINYIFGPSGCGKSTLIDIVCDFQALHKGSITFSSNFNWKGKNLISYVDANPFLISKSLIENITLGKKVNEKLLERIINISCLDEYIKNNGIYSPVTNLGATIISKGQQQRVGIARSLLCDTPIICFDETFSGLDKKTAIKIFQNLVKYYPNKIFIIVGHQIFLKEFSNKILEIN